MKFVNIVLPIMKDKAEQDDVRRAIINLLKNLNELDTEVFNMTNVGGQAVNPSVYVGTLDITGTLPTSASGTRVWRDASGFLKIG